MSAQETSDLIQLATLLYMVLLPGGIALALMVGMWAEWRERRRIPRIVRSWKSDADKGAGA